MECGKISKRNVFLPIEIGRIFTNEKIDFDEIEYHRVVLEERIVATISYVFKKNWIREYFVCFATFYDKSFSQQI